jgi:tetratricopeptide (TPR) repeat protein
MTSIVYAGIYNKLRTDPVCRKPRRSVNWDLFCCSTILFFLCCPFFGALHSIGLAPGIIFLLIISYLYSDLSRKPNAPSIVALLLVGIFIWLWLEAGRPGLVVMPVDLPEGRDDMSFTADGVANALETELENFGANEDEGTYGDTEASKILATDFAAKLFPQSPWYKGSQSRPAALEGLQVSHVIVGTNVEGFPLVGIYHILRHLRGMPLLEGQILVGDDQSLTLALRRSNAPLNCIDETASGTLLEKSNPAIFKTDGTIDGRTDPRSLIDALWGSIEKERKAWPHGVPDNLGCSVSWFRSFLDWVGIVPRPSLAEERIANVTVHELKGDEQLTVALHMAALKAMEHLSSERLALYYDNSGKYESARHFYEKTIPGLLKETHDSPPALSEFPRQRLASALVRIGDFRALLRYNCLEQGASMERMRDGFKASDRAYALAQAISPDDLLVQARVGYGYFIRAKQLQWTVNVCGNDSNELADAVESQLDVSIKLLQSAVRADSSAAGKRYGLDRTNQTLAWAYSNLAYAVLSTTPENQKMGDAERDADFAVSFSGSDPLRALTAREYVRTRSSSSTFKTPEFCRTQLAVLRNIDPIVTDSLPPAVYKVPLTLHGNLLIEEQLQKVYESLYARCRSDFTDRLCKGLEHKLLFRSLLALSYVQEGTPYPQGTLLELAMGHEGCFDASVEEMKKESLAKKQALAGYPAGPKSIAAEESIKGLQKRIDVVVKQEYVIPEHVSLQIAFLTNVLPVGKTNLCRASYLQGKDLARAGSLCAKLEALSCEDDPSLLKKAQEAADSLPEDAFLRANLGIVQLKLRSAKEALPTLRDAVRRDPRETSLRYLLSFALNGTNLPEEAREQLEYGQSLDPEEWRNVSHFLDGVPLGRCVFPNSKPRAKPH